MAKGRGKETDHEDPDIVDPKPVKPNCPRCKQHDFSSVQKTVDGTVGLFIYCTSCGCIVGWAP